jgi:hypothetical protein
MKASQKMSPENEPRKWGRLENQSNFPCFYDTLTTQMVLIATRSDRLNFAKFKDFDSLDLSLLPSPCPIQAAH